MALQAVIFDWGGTLTPWHTIEPRESWIAAVGDDEIGRAALRGREGDLGATHATSTAAARSTEVFGTPGSRTPTDARRVQPVVGAAHLPRPARARAVRRPCATAASGSGCCRTRSGRGPARTDLRARRRPATPSTVRSTRPRSSGPSRTPRRSAPRSTRSASPTRARRCSSATGRSTTSTARSRSACTPCSSRTATSPTNQRARWRVSRTRWCTAGRPARRRRRAALSALERLAASTVCIVAVQLRQDGQGACARPPAPPLPAPLPALVAGRRRAAAGRHDRLALPAEPERRHHRQRRRHAATPATSCAPAAGCWRSPWCRSSARCRRCTSAPAAR